MPIMPNVIGLGFQEAQQSLETAGVLNIGALGYFYPAFPVTAIWSKGAIPNRVTAQIPASSTQIAENAPVTLFVNEPPISVAFP